MVFFGPSLAPRRPSEEHITVSKERCIQAEAKRQIASRRYRTLMYEQLLHPKVCCLSHLVTVLLSCSGPHDRFLIPAQVSLELKVEESSGFKATGNKTH